METIIPQVETIECLSKMKLKDIFPQSIYSLNNNNQNQMESENKSNYTDNNNNNNINTSEIYTQQMNDIRTSSSYKLEKNLKDKIKVMQNNTINCIYSYNNILLISNNNELKLYDISDNFELYGSIKMPGYDKNR